MIGAKICTTYITNVISGSYVCVTKCGDFDLICKHFVTNSALNAFGQAGLGTGR